MKKAALGILVLILSGCATAPLSSTSQQVSCVAPPEPAAVAEPIAEKPAPVEIVKDTPVVAEPVAVLPAHVAKKKAVHGEMTMQERVAMANKMMVAQQKSSSSPMVVCDTTPHRMPSGQLIYESSCH